MDWEKYMQTMSSDQQQLLEKRQAHFEPFLAERNAVLVDFFERIGVTPAARVISEPDQYLSFLDQFLKAQDRNSFSPEDISYLRARLIYFVGELVIQRYSGHWSINENPSSPQFGRYVIGGFIRQIGVLTVDPAEIAQAYFEGQNGSGLSVHLTALEGEILAAGFEKDIF
jgi:hypothetical protein